MAPKRVKTWLCEEEEETMAMADRLSDIPESLQLRILSCLDTRDAVRTSVLSKSWVSLWTSIPVLNFTSHGLDAFVLNALLHRQSVKLDKLTLEHVGPSGDTISELVFDYAFSHGVEELEANMQYVKYWPTVSSDSLTSLKLTSGNTADCSFLEPKSAVSFKNLTSLHLKWVTIRDVDPFSGFPALAKLRLDFCLLTTNGNALNVHAPQLSEFTILYYDKQHVDSCEFMSPKLRYFEWRGSNFPRLTASLPILETVVIDYNGSCREIQERMMFYDLLLFFNPLHNARSLTLFSPVVHLLTLRWLSSPFPKLKFLKLDLCNPDVFQVPCGLMRLLEFLPGLNDDLLPKSGNAKCTIKTAKSDRAQARVVLKSVFARPSARRLFLLSGFQLSTLPTSVG